jgi:hypothetical protein
MLLRERVARLAKGLKSLRDLATIRTPSAVHYAADLLAFGAERESPLDLKTQAEWDIIQG